jgi:ParB family chromosome partitioning protein
MTAMTEMTTATNVATVATSHAEEVVKAQAEVTNDSPKGHVAVYTGRDVVMPLNMLFIGHDNMTTDRDEGYIHSLAATIESVGLMHRLSITIGANGQGAIHAGGNRYLALMHLLSQGKLAVDEPIECKAYENAEQALAMSLTENLIRQAVHPADKFMAFAKLAKQGRNVAQIATEMGTSVLTVERLLALAKLAPRFITMLREGKATLDQLKALCLSNSHKQQIAVWDSLNERSRSAYNIKERIVNSEVKADDTMVRFVGMDAYLAAGGKVRQDLFAENGESWLQNSVLLKELAEKKLAEAVAGEKAAGWLWVEFKESIGYYDLNSYDQQKAKSRRPAPDEAEGIEDVAAMVEIARKNYAAAETAYQKAPGGSEAEAAAEVKRGAAHDELQSLEHHLNAMREQLLQWTPEQLATCGVVVSIDREGELAYVRGLMRAEEKKAIKKAEIAKLKKEGKPIPSALQSSSGPRAAISEKLMFDLSAHRTAAMQAALKDNQHVALALTVHTMAVPIFTRISSYHSNTTPLKLRMDLTRYSKLDERASEFKESPAAVALNDAMEQWGERVPGSASVAMYRWLLAQDTATLLDLLAFCAANGLDAMHARERTQYDMSDALAESLSLDMADWWTPTPGKFLTSVSKAQLIEAVTEAESAEVARPMEKMTKADAVTYADAKLQGKRWLPAALKRKEFDATAAAAVAEEEEEYDEEEDEAGDE